MCSVRVWPLAEPMKWNRCSVTIWSVFQNPVTYGLHMIGLTSSTDFIWHIVGIISRDGRTIEENHRNQPNNNKVVVCKL